MHALHTPDEGFPGEKKKQGEKEKKREREKKRTPLRRAAPRNGETNGAATDREAAPSAEPENCRVAPPLIGRLLVSSALPLMPSLPDRHCRRALARSRRRSAG